MSLESIAGDVVSAGDAGWDDARQSWNLLIDQRPESVVMAQSAEDVAAVMRHASQNGLRVTAQGSGHAAAAVGPLDQTVLVRTRAIGGVTVDPDARRARAGAGVIWEEVCAAAGEHGLAPLAGSSPDVGIVGYSLGGGVGWLGRSHGIACNSIRAAEVVTADGEVRQVDSGNDPDLLWALRGGGGSFGVVTALEFELHPVDQLYGGAIFWPAERGPELLDVFREWTPGLPESMTAVMGYITPPPIPEVPEPIRGVPMVNLTAAFLGGEEEGAELLAPVRELGDPMMDTFEAAPAERLCRLAGDPEQPTPGITWHALLPELSEDAARAFVEVGRPESGTPLLGTAIRHLGGALSRAPEDAGALASLDEQYLYQAVGVPMAPGAEEAIRGHIGAVSQAFARHRSDRLLANFADEVTDPRVVHSPETFRRLTEIKREHDPQNLILAKDQVPPAS